jgi:hypothetical protein
MSYEKCDKNNENCEMTCPEKPELPEEDREFMCFKDEKSGENVMSFKYCEPAEDEDSEPNCEQRCPLQPFNCFEDCHKLASGEQECHTVMSYEKCDPSGKNCEMICPTQPFLCDQKAFKNTDGTEHIVEFWSHEVCNDEGCKQKCPKGMGP